MWTLAILNAVALAAVALVCGAVTWYAVDQWHTERGKREQCEKAATQQSTIVSFLCARVNELATQNGVMLRRITHLDFPVAKMTPVSGFTDGSDATLKAANPLGAMMSAGATMFEDMGDNAAAAAGIDYDDDGTVRHGGVRERPRGAPPS